MKALQLALVALLAGGCSATGGLLVAECLTPDGGWVACPDDGGPITFDPPGTVDPWEPKDAGPE